MPLFSCSPDHTIPLLESLQSSTRKTNSDDMEEMLVRLVRGAVKSSRARMNPEEFHQIIVSLETLPLEDADDDFDSSKALEETFELFEALNDISGSLLDQAEGMYNCCSRFLKFYEKVGDTLVLSNKEQRKGLHIRNMNHTLDALWIPDNCTEMIWTGVVANISSFVNRLEVRLTSDFSFPPEDYDVKLTLPISMRKYLADKLAAGQ